MTARVFDVCFGDGVVRVETLADGTLRASGVRVQVESVGHDQWRVVVDGIAHRLFAVGADETPWIWLDGVVYRPEVADAERPPRVRAHDSSGNLSAPMPATVRAIAVSPGDRVSRGDTLVVLEAMKMELPLKSPADGVVTSVACQVGDLVQPGIPLVEIA